MSAVGASMMMLSNAVVGASSYSLKAVDGRSWKHLSSSCATMSTTTPLKESISKSRSVSSSSSSSSTTTIRSVSVDSDVSTATEKPDLPLKEIPGSYGLPFFGAVKDRLDFHWFQQPPLFYEARRDKYQSTVYRTNVPPGPPFFPDPRVVVVVDQKSYPILFDVSKVEKKDIFVGTYMPSVDLTGGYRVLSYLDPSELKHKLLKQFSFDIIKTVAPRVVPEMTTAVADLFATYDAGLKKDGKVAFASPIQDITYKMILTIFTNRDPYLAGPNSLTTGFSSQTVFWLLAQIGPITNIPVPAILAPLVELTIHTFRIPFFLVKKSYDSLVNYFREYGAELLDIAEKQIGLERDEALHNLVFLTNFNTWGGVNILFPSVVKLLGTTSVDFQRELAAEVRKAVEDNGGQLTPKAVSAMPLVESAVYEVMRFAPPVPYQYAKAKEDLVIESHEAAFQIKKGETIAGYMPTACKDPKVFEDPKTFLPKRFLGEEGKALLQYVLWSNGPQTEPTTLENKHCAGKNFVLLLAHLFVASIYLKYDGFQVDSAQTNLISLTPNTSV